MIAVSYRSLILFSRITIDYCSEVYLSEQIFQMIFRFIDNFREIYVSIPIFQHYYIDDCREL